MDFVCVAATSSCQGHERRIRGFRTFVSQLGWRAIATENPENLYESYIAKVTWLGANVVVGIFAFPHHICVAMGPQKITGPGENTWGQE